MQYFSEMENRRDAAIHAIGMARGKGGTSSLSRTPRKPVIGPMSASLIGRPCHGRIAPIFTDPLDFRNRSNRGYPSNFSLSIGTRRRSARSDANRSKRHPSKAVEVGNDHEVCSDNAKCARESGHARPVGDISDLRLVFRFVSEVQTDATSADVPT